MFRAIGLAILAVAVLLVAIPDAAEAVHFYRSEDFGCSAADGALSDDGSSPEDADATILMLHDSYHDSGTGLPATHVEAGDTVTWVWNSEHCHSVSGEGGSFDSGFHYPEQTPDTPQAIPGFLDYPVPELEDPTLSFSHTFETPGVYPYSCVHHGVIGMQGIIVVE